MGVYSNAGVEQMVITPGFNFTFLQFKYLGHGIITWMTRGVHFGYDRNNFTFHFDDAFATDALWDPRSTAPPARTASDGTETTARMSAADVAYAVAWMAANKYPLTMAFNGSYAIADVADPADKSFQTNKQPFRWLNHGYEHIYQGCLQNVSVTPWVCQLDAGSQPVWTPTQTILDEINQNITVGTQLQLPFDVHEYLSGEHSGLAYSHTTANPGRPRVTTRTSRRR